MTKIIWGIDIPVSAITFRGWDTQKNEYVYEPCVVRKTCSFELCEVCGEQLTGERLKGGLTSCSPECAAKRWDIAHGLVIARERQKKGERPSRFWEIIKSECFRRDKYTCRRCGKSEEKLSFFMESETVREQSNGMVRRSDFILNAHHIIPIRTGGDNSPGNLITLCGKCHHKEHSADANIRRKHLCLESFGVGPNPVSDEG